VTKDKVNSKRDQATAEPPATLSSLQRERDDLSRRLNDALARLAGSDAGTFSVAGPDSGPQHDQLLLSFRQLKLQDFQALSFSLYSIWQKRPGNDTRPAYALALCREKLAREVLLEGCKLLAVRRSTDAEGDLEAVRRSIYESIRSRFKMRNTPPAELEIFRGRAFSLLSIAGLARLPQISLPLCTFDGCPLGLSIIGPRGSDQGMLDWAANHFD